MAGGGDAAALAEYVLAALDADDGAPQADQRLTAVIATARRAHDVEIEVLALDTLARIHAEQGRTSDAWALLDTADRIMPAVHDLITDKGRIGRDRARSLLEGMSPLASGSLRCSA